MAPASPIPPESAASRGSGRVLGVDYGERKTGLAMSDESQVIAFPRSTVESTRADQAAAAVARYAEAEKASKIVVGWPLDMSGGEGPRVAATRKFLDELRRRTELPIETWDERLSTKIAENVLIAAGTRREKRGAVVDKLAAQVILQSYLDAHGFSA